MINNESNVFYRKRDLLLIFKRCTDTEKLDFKDFLKIFCKNH